MSQNAQCVKWDLNAQVTHLSIATRSVQRWDNVRGVPMDESYVVVRVYVSGNGGEYSGEFLVATHDAPKIGDKFRIVFERVDE